MVAGEFKRTWRISWLLYEAGRRGMALWGVAPDNSFTAGDPGTMSVACLLDSRIKVSLGQELVFHW